MTNMPNFNRRLFITILKQKKTRKKISKQKKTIENEEKGYFKVTIKCLLPEYYLITKMKRKVGFSIVNKPCHTRFLTMVVKSLHRT